PEQGRSQIKPKEKKRRFCTQKCLLGLRRRSTLDDNCPNVALHRGEDNSKFHLTNTTGLIRLLKDQLDRDVNCIKPMAGCGSAGAPFKITCERFGYTVVGKGTTCYVWPQVSAEEDVYRVLASLQGSVVPVFLGKIDLEKSYFLLEVGDVRHMLLMSYGGDTIMAADIDPWVRDEKVEEAVASISSLGVRHRDLHSANILWNKELREVMIIDFNLSELSPEVATKKKR
ncbi:hypothetical protein P170DRAFT_319782, partial [Aspergillus steynii IBT 23096]